MYASLFWGDEVMVPPAFIVKFSNKLRAIVMVDGPIIMEVTGTPEEHAVLGKIIDKIIQEYNGNIIKVAAYHDVTEDNIKVYFAMTNVGLLELLHIVENLFGIRVLGRDAETDKEDYDVDVAIALYLISRLYGGDTERLNRIYDYVSAVMDLVSSLDFDRYAEIVNSIDGGAGAGRDPIIDFLVERGIVKLDPQELILINGKSIEEVLDKVYDELVDAGYIISNIVNKTAYGLMEYLGVDKNELARTPFVRAMIWAGDYPPPEVLLAEYEGDPVYKHISRVLGIGDIDYLELYIHGAPIEYIKKILMDEKYTGLLRRAEEYLLERLNINHPDILTEYISTKYPYITGFQSGPRLRLGRFTVYVLEVDALSRSPRYVGFLLGDPMTRKGYPVIARSLDEVDPESLSVSMVGEAEGTVEYREIMGFKVKMVVDYEGNATPLYHVANEGGGRNAEQAGSD